MVLDDINLNNTGKCGRRINTRKGVKVDTSLTFNIYIYIYTQMCARKISTLKMIGGKSEMGSEMVGIRERQIGNLTPLCKKGGNARN